MGREFELKYAATPEILEKIGNCFGDFTPFAMETVYYDTPDGLLSRQKITLRRRLENGRAVCTLKTPISQLGRGEWEMESGSIQAALPILWAQSGLGDCPDPAALTAVCGARFTRLAKKIQASGCTLELALDQGVLTGGGREAPLCEVEAELKSGEEAALLVWGAALAAEYGLSPEEKSKVSRARALAKGADHGTICPSV